MLGLFLVKSWLHFYFFYIINLFISIKKKKGLSFSFTSSRSVRFKKKKKRKKNSEVGHQVAPFKHATVSFWPTAAAVQDTTTGFACNGIKGNAYHGRTLSNYYLFYLLLQLQSSVNPYWNKTYQWFWGCSSLFSVFKRSFVNTWNCIMLQNSPALDAFCKCKQAIP